MRLVPEKSSLPRLLVFPFGLVVLLGVAAVHLRPDLVLRLAHCPLRDATGLPCHILLTKADKLKRGPAQAALLKVRKALPAGASAQVFSAKNRAGLDEWLAVMRAWYGYEDGETTERPD